MGEKYTGTEARSTGKETTGKEGSPFRVVDVHYSYLEQYSALNGINLEIPPGARIAFVGPNGSGKSTLLRLLDGLYFAQKGEIWFRDLQLLEKTFSDETIAYDFRRKVGFLFQDPEAQLFSASVLDEICFGPMQLGWDRQTIASKAGEMLKQFGLEHLKDRGPHRLSVGEKKKVALASVLITEPEVLLLDEPTASLDPRSQSVLLDILQEWTQQSKTIVTSTHDLGILHEICETVFVLQDGKVVFTGTPQELLSNRDLLSATNLIHEHTHRHKEVVHVHPHTHEAHQHTHDDEDL